jgi:hypothetical protein
LGPAPSYQCLNERCGAERSACLVHRVSCYKLSLSKYTNTRFFRLYFFSRTVSFIPAHSAKNKSTIALITRDLRHAWRQRDLIALALRFIAQYKRYALPFLGGLGTVCVETVSGQTISVSSNVSSQQQVSARQQCLRDLRLLSSESTDAVI